MAAANTSQNDADLRALCGAIQEDITMQKTRIERETVESSDEIKQWFSSQAKPVSIETATGLQTKIELAKKEAMVSPARS